MNRSHKPRRTIVASFIEIVTMRPPPYPAARRSDWEVDIAELADHADTDCFPRLDELAVEELDQVLTPAAAQQVLAQLDDRRRQLARILSRAVMSRAAAERSLARAFAKTVSVTGSYPYSSISSIEISFSSGVGSST